MDNTSTPTTEVVSQAEEARLRDMVAAKPRVPLLEREHVLGYLLLVPALVLIITFMVYPFGLGIWFSLTDKLVGNPGKFIGLKNYFKSFESQIFWQSFFNTFIFTFAATVYKTSLGMWLALILNRKFRLARFTRAAVLLPFIVPTVLSTLAWLWMFDATFSVFNWVGNWFWKLDISIFDIAIKEPSRGRFRINWLVEPGWAMFSIILVNIWRGTPFFAISFLAGLQTVPPDMFDAGAIDGANGWQRFWNITLPMIKPIVVVLVVFSIVVTFADFQLVYVLTRGGPHNSTHLLVTLAFQLGMASGNLGEGAAIALFMLSFLAVLILWQLLYLRKEEGA
jgi:multiple sugar transport system permease protein